jgi:hypothetical protein
VKIPFLAGQQVLPSKSSNEETSRTYLLAEFADYPQENIYSILQLKVANYLLPLW